MDPPLGGLLDDPAQQRDWEEAVRQAAAELQVDPAIAEEAVTEDLRRRDGVFMMTTLRSMTEDDTLGRPHRVVTRRGGRPRP